MKWPSGLILGPVIAGLVGGALFLGAQTSDENAVSNDTAAATTTSSAAEVNAAATTETSSAAAVADATATTPAATPETSTAMADAVPAPATAATNAPAESPVKEAATTPATTDSGTPAAAAPAEAAPAETTDEAQPVTVSAGGTPAPAASTTEPAKPDSGTQPAATAPAAAPPAEKAKPAEAAETNKPETFDLDRGVPAVTNGKTGAKPAEAEATELPPKKSFWSWFRRDKKPAAEPKVEAGAQIQAVSAAAGATNVPAAEGFKTPEEKLAAQEEVRRQAQEVAGLKALDQAYQAMGRNEFDDALKLFSQAMDSLPSRPQTIAVRNKAREGQAECEYRLALNHYKAGNLAEAKNALRRSLSYNPAFAKANRLNERIKNEESRKIESAARPVPPKQAADYLDKEKRIQAAIARGKQYMAIKEYEKAKYEFRNVLIEDAKNEEAGANLKKIAEEEYSLDSKQMERQQKEMMDQVRDTWTPAVKQEIAGPAVTAGPAEPMDKMRAQVLEKLNRIVIPEMVFRQANIVDVVTFLNEQSIVGDKESPPSDRGVNIILNLRRPGPAAAAPAGETTGTSAEGEITEGAAAGAAFGIPTVTLTLRNIVLLDAIKIITEVTSLKYRIEGNAVVITPADVAVGTIETRTYKVQSTISEIVFSGTTAGGEGEKGGLSTELGGSTITTQAGDVKKFFVDAGVPFPEGTSLVYKPSLNMLIVSNTRENLEKFESILAKLNVVPAQIEIEARFIEVNQEDLEELGVEWLLTDNWEIAMNKSSGAPVPVGARERIQVDKNSFTKGLRYAKNFGDYASDGQLGSLLSISSVLTNPELKFVLHALEQQSHGNLLSAPKVTTKTGANAEIKIVREIIYPTDFEVTPPTSQGSAGSQSQVAPGFVTPQSFEKRDTGVILNVTPNVEPDGFTINLTMLPQVVELADWINYGTWIPDGRGGLQQMNIPQPVFHSRTIATTISIWDGQTVVMGGLIAEIQETSEDKIPFLGDIPLLGYLFKSKTTSSIKRNLLIFVTANLVDPAGNKINKPGTEALATTKTTPGVSAAGGATATP